MTMSRLQANRTTFNDSTSPADPVTGTTWTPRSITLAPTGFDPIGFTDPITGRSIFGELVVVGGSTNAVLSDDDLATVSNARCKLADRPRALTTRQSAADHRIRPPLSADSRTGRLSAYVVLRFAIDCYCNGCASFDGGNVINRRFRHILWRNVTVCTDISKSRRMTARFICRTKAAAASPVSRFRKIMV